jgi:hypothetical protein
VDGTGLRATQALLKGQYQDDPAAARTMSLKTYCAVRVGPLSNVWPRDWPRDVGHQHALTYLMLDGSVSPDA